MNNRLRALLFFVLLFSVIVTSAQEAMLKITPQKMDGIVTIDGKIDEPAWEKIQVLSGFNTHFPQDTTLSKLKTEVRLSYDESALYVAAKCFFGNDNQVRVRNLRRDFDYTKNDGFTLLLSPANDNTNGFAFTVNARGAQAESLIHSGSGTTMIWDNKWNCATEIKDSFWTLEIKVPFNTLRYDERNLLWGINFIRVDIGENENSTWTKLPREFPAFSLNFTGEMAWEKIPEVKKNLSLIPYISSSIQKKGNSKMKTGLDAGLDAKIAVTSSLNLDLTINPDFSQVEADAQQINLDRFSLYFPERRNFFIENEDLFSRFGFSKIRPFFSRRIGISNDGALVPILFGARLSGNLSPNTRVGLLNVQTAKSNDSLLAENFTVACFQRKIGGGNLAGILVNKEVLNEDSEVDYNRVLGLDYNVLSKNNRLRGKLFYHQSFSDDNSAFQYAHASWLTYRSPTVTYTWNHEYVDKNYQADVGFVPRQGLGYWRLEPAVQKFFYAKSEKINYHGPKVYYDLYTNEDLDKTDERIQLSYYVNSANTSNLTMHYTHTYLKLLSPFNPISSDSLLFAEGDYEWNDVSFNFNPVSRKKFSFGFFGQYGAFYLGNKTTYGGTVNYRVEPYLQLSLAANFNYLNMPDPYMSENLLLISPRVDVSLSKKVFISSLVQINQQTQKMALNGRLQYRFKPMSDFYLVFNQNINTETNQVEQTSVILKFNYWFNA